MQARIVTWRGEDVPQVPTSALVRRGGAWMAFGLEGGKAGVYALNIFSGIFGPVPSKVLFSFLLLSSLIFALDILYKDILAA